MTEFVEGAIREVRSWIDGKGFDVILDDDKGKYFYFGSELGLDKRVGGAGKFEIQDGEGPFKGKYEILNYKDLVTNPELPPPPKPPPGMHKKDGFVQIPLSQFQQVMNMKSALHESRTRALSGAVEVYKAMNDVEKDPIAAGEKTVKIARVLEGYLV